MKLKDPALVLETIKTKLLLDGELGNDFQTQISYPSNAVKAVLYFLFVTEGFHFDYLNSITCIDNGLEKDSFDIIYSITSIINDDSLHIKTSVPKNDPSFQLNTVSDIWASADWHEREIFDLFGLKFKDHQDLRRILLPADWEGHPMRKDYVEQEKYHSIKVKY